MINEGRPRANLVQQKGHPSTCQPSNMPHFCSKSIASKIDFFRYVIRDLPFWAFFLKKEPLMSCGLATTSCSTLVVQDVCKRNPVVHKRWTLFLSFFCVHSQLQNCPFDVFGLKCTASVHFINEVINWSRGGGLENLPNDDNWWFLGIG